MNNVLDITKEVFDKDFIRRDMAETKQRDRTNESYLYVSPAHKAKLKAYTQSTRRTMRSELELWIDSLPTKEA